MKQGRRRIGTLLFGILLLAGVLWFLPTFSGPEFPGGALAITPARMSVPSADCYRDERFRVLLLAREGESSEARFTWTPPDGEGSARTLGDDARIPALSEPSMLDRLFNLSRLVPKVAQDSPALLFTADPDLPGLPLPSRDQIGASRIYLGGVGPDGELRAVPFQADPNVCQSLLMLGALVTPKDWIAGLGPGCAVELRITRDGDRVHYRWGPDPLMGSEPRFSWGSADLSVQESTEGGDEPLLPALAELLHREGSSASPKVVLLETGTGVRYVDILRAVECGGGDPMVAFTKYPISSPWQPEDERLRPPAGAESLLVEVIDVGRQSSDRAGLVRFFEEDLISIRAIEYDPDRFKEWLEVAGPGQVIFRGGRDSRWADRIPVIQDAIRSGAEVYFRMAPLDPALRIESAFHLPMSAGKEPTLEVSLVRVEGVLRPEPASVVGRAVSVRVPADAKLEETVHALIHLRKAGATAFSFE